MGKHNPSIVVDNDSDEVHSTPTNEPSLQANEDRTSTRSTRSSQSKDRASMRSTCSSQSEDTVSTRSTSIRSGQSFGRGVDQGRNGSKRETKNHHPAERHNSLGTCERQRRTRANTSPPNSPHPARTGPPTVRHTSDPPRPISPVPRQEGKDTIGHVQDRHLSFLDHLNRHIGDAQASPHTERNTLDDSPIDMAVRQVQEAGFSIRAKTLRTGDFVFITSVDVFQREPLENIEDISLAFHLFSILIQEGVMQRDDFVRAIRQLCEEEQFDGCNLLLQLIFSDKRIVLTERDRRELDDTASRVKLYAV